MNNVVCWNKLFMAENFTLSIWILGNDWATQKCEIKSFERVEPWIFRLYYTPVVLLTALGVKDNPQGWWLSMRNRQKKAVPVRLGGISGAARRHSTGLRPRSGKVHSHKMKLFLIYLLIFIALLKFLAGSEFDLWKGVALFVWVMNSALGFMNVFCFESINYECW